MATEFDFVAKQALLDIAQDKTAPAAARATAARSLLEISGILGGRTAKPSEIKALDEMSRADLEKELSRLSGQVASE